MGVQVQSQPTSYTSRITLERQNDEMLSNLLELNIPPSINQEWEDYFTSLSITLKNAGITNILKQGLLPEKYEKHYYSFLTNKNYLGLSLLVHSLYLSSDEEFSKLPGTEVLSMQKKAHAQINELKESPISKVILQYPPIHPDSIERAAYSYNQKRKKTKKDGTPYYVLHRAVDLAAYTGTPIYSAVDGKVVSSRYSDSGTTGNMVIIKGNDGYYYFHCHMDKRNARVGQTIKAGTKIGTVGTTGLSPPAPHLHFEIRTSLNGGKSNIDPEQPLKEIFSRFTPGMKTSKPILIDRIEIVSFKEGFNKKSISISYKGMTFGFYFSPPYTKKSINDYLKNKLIHSSLTLEEKTKLTNAVFTLISS